MSFDSTLANYFVEERSPSSPPPPDWHPNTEQTVLTAALRIVLSEFGHQALEETTGHERLGVFECTTYRFPLEDGRSVTYWFTDDHLLRKIAYETKGVVTEQVAIPSYWTGEGWALPKVISFVGPGGKIDQWVIKDIRLLTLAEFETAKREAFGKE